MTLLTRRMQKGHPVASGGGGGGFPALADPPVFVSGDSYAAKEHFVLAIGASALARDGVTNLGRITAPITNSGSNAQFGTPRVYIANLTDTSLEVMGRNNYQDSTTTGVSIHTIATDRIGGISADMTGVPSFNPSTAASGVTQAISNGTIINLERISRRGVTPWTNSLMGGSMNIIANLGHPGAFISNGAALSAQAASELAYLKQLCAAQTNPVVFVRWGINDIKGAVSPNVTFAALKLFVDGLTGLDGQGGNAVVVLRSCSFLGSAASVSGSLTPQQLNEQVIGKCATQAAPGVLNPDATQYTFPSAGLQNTHNYQQYQYALAHPSKILFADVSTPSYDFVNHCMYDATFPDGNSKPHTGDGTHTNTGPNQLDGVAEASALMAAGMTFATVVPRSAADATTPGGRTRMANRGPWVTGGITSGFLTGGSGTQPTGWACGRIAGVSGTMVTSVSDPGDGLGMWVDAVCTFSSTTDSLAFYPWGSSGASLATYGILANQDQAEYQLVFELKWSNGFAGGLGGIQTTFRTNGSGLYGLATNGESNDVAAGDFFPDSSPVGNVKIATGWVQMSGPLNNSITVLVPEILVRCNTVTGTPTVNVSIRCVGVNKR